MAKTMRKHGIAVTHRDDGTWKVSGSAPWNGEGARWETVVKTFREAGAIAFEMADNNDFGREINWKMCKVFGREFFAD